jgi:hypothetical protein
MKVAALLIFWSLSLLPAAGSGLSPPFSATADADFHVTLALIQQPIEADFPGDLGNVRLGSPCWDEEDSLDEHLIADELLPGPLSWASVSDHRSWFAHAQCDLVRSPSHPLPLRC